MRDHVLIGVVLVCCAGAPATAQQSPRGGETSGAGVGGVVTPSTVMQKRFEGRSAFTEDEALQRALEAGAIAAGAPGVAGKRGAQSGAAPHMRETGERVY